MYYADERPAVVTAPIIGGNPNRPVCDPSNKGRYRSCIPAGPAPPKRGCNDPYKRNCPPSN